MLWLYLVLDFALLLGGCWLIFFTERLQIRITAYHEELKRTHHASRLWVQVSSMNYEMLFRLLGAVMLLASLALLVVIGQHWERYSLGR